MNFKTLLLLLALPISLSVAHATPGPDRYVDGTYEIQMSSGGSRISECKGQVKVPVFDQRNGNYSDVSRFIASVKCKALWNGSEITPTLLVWIKLTDQSA